MDADAASRYKKIVADPESMDDLLVDLFLEAHDTSPAEFLAKGENPRADAALDPTIHIALAGPDPTYVSNRG